MKITDSIKLRGKFAIKVWHRDGTLIEEYEDNNLIVDAGRACLAILLGDGTAARVVTKIGVGTNGTAPAAGDTALTGSFSKALDSHTNPTATSVAFEFTIDTGDTNGTTIQEYGLLTTGDHLFARKTRAAIAKTSDIRITGTWTIEL